MPELCQWRAFQEEPYETIHQFQQALVEQRIRGEIPDTLLLGQHPHVITLGRRNRPDNLPESMDVPVVEIERGGDVTYHGPGQMVGYPILQLKPDERDLHRYLRSLEEVLIRVLRHYGLRGERKSGWTGVWVGEQKIASIGVAVRKWVTFHGFALNVSTDLSYFHCINPCGLPASVMTSIQTLLPDYPADALKVESARGILLQEFETVFNRVFIYHSHSLPCHSSARGNPGLKSS